MSVNKTITNESTERERNEVFIESQVVREKTFDKTMDRFEVEYGNNSEEIKNLKTNLDSTNTQLSELESHTSENVIYFSKYKKNIVKKATIQPFYKK